MELHIAAIKLDALMAGSKDHHVHPLPGMPPRSAWCFVLRLPALAGPSFRRIIASDVVSQFARDIGRTGRASKRADGIRCAVGSRCGVVGWLVVVWTSGSFFD